MGSDPDHTDHYLDRHDEEIAGELAEEADTVIVALPEHYRGEVSQAIRAQDRIDQTTNLPVTALVAPLAIVYSSPDMPAYLLLIGFIAFSAFVSYEVCRYRFCDLYRCRA